MFYCMFYFTCDRSLTVYTWQISRTRGVVFNALAYNGDLCSTIHCVSKNRARNNLACFFALCKMDLTGFGNKPFNVIFCIFRSYKFVHQIHVQGLRFMFRNFSTLPPNKRRPTSYLLPSDNRREMIPISVFSRSRPTLMPAYWLCLLMYLPTSNKLIFSYFWRW